MKHQHKNISRRLAAAMMAGAMMVSMVGMTAFASGITTPDEGTNSITGVTVDKTITTDGKTYAPNTTIDFSVWLGSGGEFNDGVGGTFTSLPGEAGGLTEASITFTPDPNNLSETYTGTATLGVDVTKFDKVGIYHYIVMEENGNYDGMNYSSDIYDVYLYVTNENPADPSDSDLVVSYVVCNAQDGNKTKTDLAFVNNYGANDTPEDDGEIHDVIVDKQVTGTMGDKRNDEFEFSVKVDGAEGELYLVEIDVTGDGRVDATQTITSGNETLIGTKIKHNGTIHIYGLSENDTYTVTELSANQNGYVTTDTDEESESGVVSGHALQDNTQETITNQKDATTPTGIAMTIAPYAIMVVAAAGVAFLFLRRRNSEF